VVLVVVVAGEKGMKPPAKGGDIKAGIAVLLLFAWL